ARSGLPGHAGYLTELRCSGTLIAPGIDRMHCDFASALLRLEGVLADIVNAVGHGTTRAHAAVRSDARTAFERDHEECGTRGVFDPRVVVKRVPRVVGEVEEHQRQFQQPG